MNNSIWIISGAFLCLGVLVILGLLILFIFMRKGKQVIDQQTEVSESVETVNTRWARADLKSDTPTIKPENALLTCPACGGSNPTQASDCQFCGRSL